MKNTFGFIGTGNMGGAMARAAAKGIAGENIMLSNRTAEKAECLARELGCKAVPVLTVAGECEYIFLGVKPQMMEALLGEIAPVLKSRADEFVLVSMAAGLTMADIRRMAGGEYPVIRIMPNTPVAVGDGVVIYDTTDNVSQSALNEFLQGMRFVGLLDQLPEQLIDAASAIAGSGPAFACMFIEALADGGVACGLPRVKAMEYAAQMLIGTGKLYLENGQHPAAMKDAVCSPAGSTIAGVRALEQGAFRASAMAAVEATFQRNRELGK